VGLKDRLNWRLCATLISVVNIYNNKLDCKCTARLHGNYIYNFLFFATENSHQRKTLSLWEQADMPWPRIIHRVASCLPLDEYLLWWGSFRKIVYMSACYSKNTVAACRRVAEQRQLDKQMYKIGYWVTASQTNMFPRQRLKYNNEERCFLLGPCRGVTSGTELRA
jgi:hypothetical protein